MFRIGIVLLLLFLSSTVFAQQKLDFNKLSVEDGFSGSKANAIIQDSKGFIWIGTWNGLNRYDGYHCEIFRPDYHDSTTISSREVVELLEDKEGNIWIGTSSGLNCLNPATLDIRRYEFDHRIIALYEDKLGQIWVGTWNDGLYRLNPQSGDTEHFLLNDIVSDIFEDSRGNLWIATYYGLVNFDRNTSGYVRYLPNENKASNSISHSIITNIVESENGDLWLGSWGGGLDRVKVHPNRDSLQFIHYMAGSGEHELSSNVVYRLYYDDFDNLWIGTWDQGLNLLVKEQQQKAPGEAVFYSYQTDLSDAYSLSGNNVTSLFVDRSGILWVGSSKIDRANINKTGVTRYKTNRLVDHQYIESYVRIFEEQDPFIWVGSSSELMLYKKDKQQYRNVKNIGQLQYRFDNYTYTSNSVMSIIHVDDELWVGTEDAGLLWFDARNPEKVSMNRFSFLNTATQPALPGNKVSNLFASKKYKGVIWGGTMQNGFFSLYRTAAGIKVKHYRAGRDSSRCSDNNIRAIYEDHRGKVWIGTQNGLNCFDPETETFQKFFYSLPDTNSINDNVINVIYEDHLNNLWIGTNAGLNKKLVRKADDGTETIYFKGYPKVDNLNNEIILNILEDDFNHLWLGFYRGLVQFNEEEEKIVKEYFTNEFQNVRIQRSSALKTNNGLLFFGGDGFLSFNPDSLFKNSLAPQVGITDVLVYNESIQNRKDKYQLDQTIPYLEGIELSYRDEVLTFVFSAMDFKNPEKNRYAYILEGYDKQWNEIGSRNTATYTGIPPGDYVFKVKAANSDGVWSIEPVSFDLSVKPPWWRTIWAYLFYVILIFGLLYFFKEYSIIQVREKSRIMLEHLHSEEKERLNELKAHFFTDITHEFRTPLTLILGPARELKSMGGIPSYAVKQADLIQRNAHKLLRLVNQLMEFRVIEKGKTKLNIQRCDVVELMDGLYESFKPMADTRNIDFKISYNSPAIIAWVDCEKFEKVVYNIVSNAFKYSEDEGQIGIIVALEENDKEEKVLVIEVEDSGIGIADEYKEKVFERFFQVHQKRTQNTGGIGLYISKSLIEEHGGTIELDSEPGKGSCFRIAVPVGDGHQLALNENDEAMPAQAAKHVAIEESAENEAMPARNGNNSKLPTVLIVEDDNDMNEFLVSGLSSGFNVLASFNGREGLELAHKANPDIIVTDIMMPEMDGFELCKALRKDLSTSHIPVIFLTAKTMHEDEIKGLKLGAIDYVYKPFNLISLKLKIQNVLDNRKSLHEKMRAEQLLAPETIELSSLDETFLKDAVDAVNKFLDDSSFDVEKFSQEIGISANQAYRKIKALTGQTAKEFIRNQRLKTAASLLLQERRSISEIIYMVGFSSPSYFTRCFKEYYGCTPKEYIDRKGNVE
ncbi:hybrid sensor histidine kinase/response regulator transcription factor [Roseimarinus sediminis]|uniref:hybrid sensor histidine kinase/response regulator transcription factor n=1 Tax=Roseimarinus sediminis TaxID=1610899 RepID=UPI003D1A1AD4